MEEEYAIEEEYNKSDYLIWYKDCYKWEHNDICL